MTEKNIKSRIVHKHDIEAHWNLAENFIPLQGEIVIYDIDENYNYERFKIGDGKTNVNELPFATSNNSGSGDGIIDVDELPTEASNTQVLYRTLNAGKVIKAEIATAGQLAPELGTVEVVDVLPSAGKAVMDAVSEKYYAYYLTSENDIYGYITEFLASNLGVPAGWYKLSDMGVVVTIIDSADKAITEDLYVVVTRQPQLFHNANGSFERLVTEHELADYKAIVDVDDFSKHNANSHTLYRSKGEVTQVTLVSNKEAVSASVCDVVDILPESGQTFIDNATSWHFMYQKKDDTIYGYLGENITSTTGLAAGWVSIDVCLAILREAMGSEVSFGGNIDSLEDAIGAHTLYALVTREDTKPNLYYYREFANGSARGELGAGYSEVVSIKEETLEEICPETTIHVPQDGTSPGVGLVSEKELLVKGANYKVIFEGVSYECVCKVTEDGVLYVGNRGTAEEDTGEPFAIVYDSYLGGTVLGTGAVGDYTLSIFKAEVTTREEEVVHKIDPKYYDAGSVVRLVTPTTYNELKALRDNAQLVPGMFYRITDYVCTTVQENTGAMNNQFDIIIQAINERTLSETASADLHEGDTYFADTNFGAWELRYCLDNDSSRFAWALDKKQSLKCLSQIAYFIPNDILERCPDMDWNCGIDGYGYAWTTKAYMFNYEAEKCIYTNTEEVSATGSFAYYSSGGWLRNSFPKYFDILTEKGKGVIYYMKDEFGNECPYDFKNITYKGESICNYEGAGLSADTYYPTFIEPVSLAYSQWGKTDSVSRNSSLDTTINGVTYYGYTCGSAPISWSSPNFYVTDATITTSSAMYSITDGVASQISMGGQLTPLESRNNTIKPYVRSGVYTLPCIVFVSTSNSNIVGNNCYTITFYGNCIRNTVGEECYNLSFSSASNTAVFCGTQYYYYEGNANDNETSEAQEYYPMLTYLDIGYSTTIESIASILEQRGLLGSNLIIRFVGVRGGDFIGYVKLNDDGTYDFEFRALLGYNIYSGNGVSSTTTWGDIMLYNVQEYSTNPIADLEARTAALENNFEQGSTASSGGIIDITEFPSNPSTTSIYRKWQVVKAEWMMDGQIITDGGMTCEVVNTLPEVGVVCYTGSAMYSYYQRADGECYGYVDSNLSATMGVPAGWYPAAVLFGALGFSYNGMIDSLADATTGYFLLLTKKPHLYHYYDDNKGSIVKSAIITNDNYDFDENLGILTQVIVL